MSRPGNITIKNARLIFRNFAGEEGMYNRKGDRNFNVILPQDVAEELEKDGWNVKYLKPQDDDAERGDAYLQVSVSYKNRPPLVALITSRGRVNLSENEVEILDWVDIAKADMIINPYEWAVNGKSGIKAYLKSLFVTQDEDELEREYADVPEINQIEERKTLEIENIIDGEVVED